MLSRLSRIVGQGVPAGHSDTGRFGLVALILAGLAAIGAGLVGFKNRRLVIKGTVYEGLPARAWAAVLVALGIGCVGFGAMMLDARP